VAEPLKFALVGCGRIAPRHIDALKHAKGAQLVAVCDSRIERARQIAQKESSVRAYGSLADMLSEERSVDVVSILTPSGMHAEHAIQAARAGKHVVVEKPMALRLEDADRMLETCDRAGIKLFVVQQNRYNVAVQQARQALDAGRFGRLLLGTVRVRWCRRQEYYDHDSWRGTWALDGGVFANQASHHIDLLQWMFGSVSSVFARTAQFLARIEAEDTGVAVLKFQTGALGLVEATTATRPRDLEGSLSILGERGTVEIGGFAVNEMRVWQFEEQSPMDETVRLVSRESPPNVYGFGHRAYIQNVVDSLCARGSALVDGFEGRKSLELIHAIYESAATGREVGVPCVPTASRLGKR
jgi:predicted dehydrogenase